MRVRISQSRSNFRPRENCFVQKGTFSGWLNKENEESLRGCHLLCCCDFKKDLRGETVSGKFLDSDINPFDHAQEERIWHHEIRPRTRLNQDMLLSFLPSRHAEALKKSFSNFAENEFVHDASPKELRYKERHLCESSCAREVLAANFPTICVWCWAQEARVHWPCFSFCFVLDQVWLGPPCQSLRHRIKAAQFLLLCLQRTRQAKQRTNKIFLCVFSD